MGNNGCENLKIPSTDMAECSETTVEIKIKTLDSQTFTLRVDKYVPVPELKEQIASLTGVLSEQQRLICRGKVLKDDQRLSAYHVEDGHTLHLIVRQPVAPPDLSDRAESDPTSNSHSPGMVVGTFNISEQGDGAFPDLSRIVSAVLNSFGVTRLGSGGEGIDLNQSTLERSSTSPGLSGTRNSGRQQTDQAFSVAIPVESLQPPVIPGSLTTLLQYLGHLRQEFIAIAGGISPNRLNAVSSGTDAPELEAAAHSGEPRGLLTPEFLAEVMMSTRQLLVEQATESLVQLAGQLQSHSSVVDPVERSRIQSNAIRAGALFQNLGALLLELGRAIMTLRMGQTSADALVNAGPSVFVSSTGPNPIMVQPLPFQPGTSLGSVPIGAVQHGAGLAGGSATTTTGFLPRNIDIRIRTGSSFSRRDTTGSQPQAEDSQIPLNSTSSDRQDAATLDSNAHNREPQMRPVPLRTVVAAVPASVGRNLDPSRGSIGILYPVLARVQHVSLGNSHGTRASQGMDSNHHNLDGNTGHDSTTPVQNIAEPGGNGNGNTSLPSEALNVEGLPPQIRGGLEQLLNSIFTQEHIINDSGNHSTLAFDSTRHTEPPPAPSQEPGPAVSEEGLFLSNILRQILPMFSENTEAEPLVSAEDESQPQDDDARRMRGPPPEPSSKRQKKE